MTAPSEIDHLIRFLDEVCERHEEAHLSRAELATLRSHSAALRTIAEKHPNWWVHRWDGVSGARHDTCIACSEDVTYPPRAEDRFKERPSATHTRDCWAAPIIAMMEGMVKGP